MSHQAELVSHEHIPHEGHISQSSHPKHVWVSLVAAGMGVCVCTDVSACGSGLQLALGRLCPSCSLLCFTHPPQLPHPSAQNYSEKRILSLVCAPEKLPCFFLAAPLAFLCSSQSFLGFGQVLCLNPCKMEPFCLTAGSEWPVGCLCRILSIPHMMLAMGGEDCQAHRELSPPESQFWALPCLDGQVCSATPVPPHLLLGFGVFV